MKKLFVSLIAICLMGLTASSALAAGAERLEAKVLNLVGSVQVTLPGASQSVAATAGMMLPEGTEIVTGAGSEMNLQTMAGTITTFNENSTVTLEKLSVEKNNMGVITKQTALLNLKSGNVISNLDPARKSINNYGVRTPKGVAAARGTIYSVGVNATGTNVATLAGTVTITPVNADGTFGTPISVDIGTGAILDAEGNTTTGTLATLAASDPAVAAGIRASVNAVSAAVENNTQGTSGSANAAQTATTVLAALVRVASQALPNEASAFASTAVNALTAPTAATGGDSATATKAVVAIGEAAAQGASLGGLSVSSAIEAAVTGSINKNASVTLDYRTLLEGVMLGTSNAEFNNRLESLSTPITPIDITVVSPSGGKR